MTYAKSAAIAIATLLLGGALNATTVVNGSFEDIGGGTLNNSGWNQFSTVPGWDGDPNVEIQSGPTLGFIDAKDGNNYAELDTNQDAGIFQDIVLGFGQHTLKFWYSPRVDSPSTTTNDMFFSVSEINNDDTTGTDLFTETISGAPNASFPHAVWTEVVKVFNVAPSDAGPLRLSFYATGGSLFQGCGNCGALIDLVSLTGPNPVVPDVPLPAGGLLVISALGGLAVLRRRKPA